MRTKWTMLTLCFVGVLINYIDRTNFSLGAPLMARELGFSPATIGLLLGAFYWLYTLALLPVGALMDRFGVRTIYPAAMIFWSLASAATALGQGVASIFTARLLMGGGESASWPANAKVVSRWFPRPQRGTATSLWHAGIGIGSAVSYPFVAYLIASFGWRASFVITGFMGGLTTFSTFSAETVAMLERGAYAGALGYAGLSLTGSLLLTGLGLATANLLR